MFSLCKLALAAGLLQAALAAALPNPVRHNIAAEGLSDNEKALPVHCADVQVIGARGTGQEKGSMGSMEGLADKITQQTGAAQSIALQYPAIMAHYQQSEGTGAYNMTQYIGFFATKCPNTKIVLLGYSQGAQVVMDALCGSTAAGFDDSTDRELAPRFRESIAAAVVWGDPSHTVPASWNRGTSKKHGYFIRDNSKCRPFAKKIASYCDTGDQYCDDGHGYGVHQSYPGKYTDASAKFVKNRIAASKIGL